MLQKSIILLIAVLQLAACASTTMPRHDIQVHLSQTIAVNIPPFQKLDHAREVSQLVVAHYADKDFAFEAHLSIDDERLILVGLDPMGRKALKIIWAQNGVTMDAEPWVPTELHAENILADIILIYWPKTFVQSWLKPTGTSMRSSATTRLVQQGGDTAIRIAYAPAKGANVWNKKVHYANDAWGYTLAIQSTEDSR